jgi:two-component system, chemotaxis family, protein-glutamate methylesterase/glutaminase
MIRVVLAEDSDTCRQLLTAAIESDGQLKIVGQAQDGEAAVSLTDSLRPDVVVMDANMPVMDGFAATQCIMLRCPTPIVIVSAALDTAAVASSMRALESGALTLLPKPTSPYAADFDHVVAQFVSTVRAMSDVKVVRRFKPQTFSPYPAPLHVPENTELRKRVRVIGIGASTGGPAALQQIFSSLPKILPVPVLVVQHIAPGFIDGLCSWLESVSVCRVKVAEHGESLKPGVIYFAPDACQLTVSRTMTFDLTQRAPVGGFSPSATALFSSLSEVFGATALGLVLTGMGSDGVDGLRALRRTGATVLAQDEATCVVFGMPKAAVDAGLVHTVLPLPLIAPRLVQMSRAHGNGYGGRG